MFISSDSRSMPAINSTIMNESLASIQSAGFASSTMRLNSSTVNGSFGDLASEALLITFLTDLTSSDLVGVGKPVNLYSDAIAAAATLAVDFARPFPSCK
jgi:hypothetical protein